MACVRQTAGFVRLNAVVTRPQKRGLFRVGLSQGDDFAHRCHEPYLKTQVNEKSIEKILKIALLCGLSPGRNNVPNHLLSIPELDFSDGSFRRTPVGVVCPSPP
jgi:hypothetical protein